MGDRKVKQVSLSDWLEQLKYNGGLNSQVNFMQLRGVFESLDIAMKTAHSRHYYITSFSPEDIYLTNNLIQFSKMSLARKESEMHQAINHNILGMAAMHIGIYANLALLDSKPCIPSFEFLRENLSSYLFLLPQDDVVYYQTVFTSNRLEYYSDHLKKKRNNEYSNQSGSEQNGKVSQYVKATPAGALYTSSMNNNEADSFFANNRAAFVDVLILPAILALISMIAVLVYCFVR